MHCGGGGVSVAMNPRHDAPLKDAKGAPEVPGRCPVTGGQGGDAGERGEWEDESKQTQQSFIQ